jgi:predicted HTH domain antitoxin
MPLFRGVVILRERKMNYPRMLYIGSVKSYKYEIAQNQDHEDELRQLGFVDFADLKSEQAQLSSGTVGSASSDDFKDAFVPVEQFDAVSEELVQKELQLNVAQTERDQFKAENDDLKEQLSKALEKNQQLQLVINSFKTESVSAAVAVDYNSLTTPQLQKLLDEKGITYLKRDDKATLIGLLTQPVKTEE